MWNFIGNDGSCMGEDSQSCSPFSKGIRLPRELGPIDTYRIPFKNGEQLWNLNCLNTVSVHFRPSIRHHIFLTSYFNLFSQTFPS